MTYSILDIANWFLSKEPMTHKKLQKLCYYAQAWGLALYNIRIMDTKFKAARNLVKLMEGCKADMGDLNK